MHFHSDFYNFHKVKDFLADAKNVINLAKVTAYKKLGLPIILAFLTLQ